MASSSSDERLVDARQLARTLRGIAAYKATCRNASAAMAIAAAAPRMLRTVGPGMIRAAFRATLIGASGFGDGTIAVSDPVSGSRAANDDVA